MRPISYEREGFPHTLRSEAACARAVESGALSADTPIVAYDENNMGRRMRADEHPLLKPLFERAARGSAPPADNSDDPRSAAPLEASPQPPATAPTSAAPPPSSTRSQPRAAQLPPPVPSAERNDSTARRWSWLNLAAGVVVLLLALAWMVPGRHVQSSNVADVASTDGRGSGDGGSTIDDGGAQDDAGVDATAAPPEGPAAPPESLVMTSTCDRMLILAFRFADARGARVVGARLPARATLILADGGEAVRLPSTNVRYAELTSANGAARRDGDAISYGRNAYRSRPLPLEVTGGAYHATFPCGG